MNENPFNLSANSLTVLKRRYLAKNEKGEPRENPGEMFARVAKNIAKADLRYDSRKNLKETEEKFFNLMTRLEFLPNSPTLMNAGRELQQLSACFVKGQKILSNPGYKDIEQIQVGDRVVTDKGRTGKVTELHRRAYKGDIYTVNVQGMMKPTLNVTGEHPVLAIKKEKLICKRAKNNRCNGFVKKYCLKTPEEYKDDCMYINRTFEAGWIPAKELKEGDFVAVNTNREIKDTPEINTEDYVSVGIYFKKGKYLTAKGRPNKGKKIPGKIKIDNNFLRLTGYWLADGSISKTCGKHGVIRFTFNAKEKRFCEDVKKIMKKKFNLTAKEEFTEKQKTIQLRFNSIIVAELFFNLFGKGFDGKKLPAWMITLPLKKQFHLAVGLFRGDGCYFKREKQDVIFVSLSNKRLASDIWGILLRLGYNFNINHRMPSGGTKEAYRISAAPSECKELAISMKKGQYRERKIFPQYIKTGDIILRPISKIETAPFDGEVYNLEVEKDHSYLANGVAVHNCFVLPIEDSMGSIFQAIKDTALIHQSGGGTGYSFSRIRPKNSRVRSTGGVASGPISFMKVFNAATQAVIQGGTRRGANMGILRVDHPDILEFIKCKENDKDITNFNISVAVTEDFMKKVKANAEYDLVDPHTKKAVQKLNAREVFDLIVRMAWKNGEPGIIFIDKMNDFNPTPKIGLYESTNPCVTGDALVSTEFGLMRIADIARKFADGGLNIITDSRILDEVYAREESGLGGLTLKTKKGTNLNRISQAWRTGTKPTFRLETKCGYELIATQDHRMMTQEGWVRVQDLKIEEHEILIQSASGRFNKNKELPFSVSNEIKGRNGRVYKFNFPCEWSKELGHILGWLIGDGWIRDDNHACVAFSFGRDDREILDYLKPILNRMCGYEVEGIMREREVFHLAYGSRQVVDFFKKLGVKIKGANDKEVPETLFTAPEEAVTGFLQALFSADGTVRSNPKPNSEWVALTSKSKKLLQGVQLLLLNMGIKSSIYDRSRKARKRLFKYLDKSGKLKSYMSDGVLYELCIFGASRERFRKKINFINNDKKSKLDNIKFTRFYEEKFFDEIRSIKYNGVKPVFDLTEPFTHSMVVNGMVTHQCGEQVLLPYESCNLGSINLSRMITGGKIDWEKLARATRGAVHFLDNVIDMNRFPLPEIEKITRANRKIGLGVMGFADMLIDLGIAYNSEEAVRTADKLMAFILKEARKVSSELAETRGVFPNFEKSIYSERNGSRFRNATVTTIAPTGTLSIIAGCSSGIEPLFAIMYYKEVMDKDKLPEVNEQFEKIAKDRGFWSEELLKKIAKKGNIQELKEVPEDVRKLFVTSHDITPEWHIRIQAAFQKYTDNAVSKTINFANSTKKEDIENTYMLAHELGCKGVTVYRDGSRAEQVLNIEKKEKTKDGEPRKDSQKIIPRPRPSVISGTTTKIATGCGNLYVTINEDEEQHPFEVFMQMGKAGGCAMSQLEAIGRLLSLALRSGIEIKSVIEQLRGIRCPSPSWEKGGRIFSCSDAIARVVEQRLLGKTRKEEKPLPEKENTSSPPVSTGSTAVATKKKTGNIVGVCPDCGGALWHVEGCMVCRSCGYSKCG